MMIFFRCDLILNMTGTGFARLQRSNWNEISPTTQSGYGEIRKES